MDSSEHFWTFFLSFIFFTCGDIFPNASDRDGCTFYPISISIFNYALYSSMDLF